MKINNVVFGEIPFRMFGNMEIPISDRITVIAGHNGIGKSTLLGLIANGSELKKNQGTTLFNTAFQAQFHELFYLDEAIDYVKIQKNRPSFKLFYSYDGKKDLVKTCNVTQHKETEYVNEKKVIKERLKIVPRGVQEGWDVGGSAKVNIPTLFLSMSRMLPIGDHQQSLTTTEIKKMNENDILYIQEKFKSIIEHRVKSENHITKHELKGTTKRSFLPEFDHSTKTISLGQDTLSSIITAFASFNKLKREHNETYCGGILLIDEIDAGFHPHAQKKLVNLIKEEAGRLDLQVILTTHSLTIIQEVLKISDETARSGRNIDSVVYIEDIYRPKLMEHPTYINIKNDMLSKFPPEEENYPQLKIYFEDEEAKWFYEQIIKTEGINLRNDYQYDFILIAAKLGCENLRKLFETDNYFHSVIIVFDNDVLSKGTDRELVENNSNIIVLPAKILSENVEPKERTPEYQVYQFINSLLSNLEHDFWNNIPTGYNIEMIKENLLNTFPMANDSDKKLREPRKDWFKKHQIHFEKIQVMNYFCKENSHIVTLFINDLRIAIQSLVDKSKKQNKQ